MHLKRTATMLRPDQSRVLLRPFSPGGPERISAQNVAHRLIGNGVAEIG